MTERDSDPDDAARESAEGLRLYQEYARTGRPELIDAAVTHLRAAASAVPADHPQRVGYLSDLAGALAVRAAEEGGGLADLDAAIVIGREVLDRTPAGQGYRPRRQSNLAAALRERYEQTGAADDLDEAITMSTSVDLDQAIEAGRAAVSVIPADHPDRALTLAHLGDARRARYERTADGADLDAAIGSYLEAADHPLASPAAALATRRSAAALTWSGHGDPAAAAAMYRQAVEAMATTVAPRHLDLADQEQLLGRHAGLVGDAIAAHVQVGDFAAAVEIVEQGRGGPAVVRHGGPR